MAPLKEHLKENNYHIIILTSITIALIVPLFFTGPKITGFAIFQETNLSIAPGVYISSIIDMGEESRWNNMSWTSTETGELTSNQDTVLLYHLNEEDGAIADSSGNNNQGTPAGNIQYNQEGKFNEALGFNGKDSYLNAGNSSALMPEQLTISAWTKIMELPGKNEQPSIISKGEGDSRYEIYLHKDKKTESNKICFEIGERLTCSKAIPELNTWYNIASTYDGTTMTLYINGETQNSTISTLTANNLPLHIGKRQGKEKSFFNGTIDEVTVFNRALDEQEIKALYKRGILSMTISVRSCDNPECDNSSWQPVNGRSPQKLTIADNRYFQYKIESATEDPAYTVDIYNLTINYQPTPKPAPNGEILGTVKGADNISAQTDSNTEDITGMRKVTLYDKDEPLTVFSHNFSTSDLNLTEISINKTSDYIILNIPQSLQNTKTVYLKDSNFKNLCLKDADIDSIDEMSPTCTGVDETDLTECLNNKTWLTIKSYTCIDNNSTIGVQNVSHSALRGTKNQEDTPATDNEQTSAGGGGGGSGGSARERNSPIKEGQNIPIVTPAGKEDKPAELPEKESKYESKVRLENNVNKPENNVNKSRITLKTQSLLATIAILLLSGVSGLTLLKRRRL